MRKLLKATMIVTIFSILTRGLGFLLRIILSRKLGAEILGNYQVAMSILGVLMTLVCSGLPLVVSRSVAYKKEIGDNKGAYKSVTAGLIIALSISILVSAIIFLFPSVLNLLFSGNVTASIVLYSLPGLIASAVYCILRSALWGDKHFFAISFTEFFEQVVRIILCFIIFSPAIFPHMYLGEKASLSLSLACIASCALVVIIYFALKNRLANPKDAFKPLLKTSSPITAVRTVSSLVQSLIAIIIPLRLTLFGYSKSEAMAQFGMIMGMAFPLIMIPGTLISSLAVTLVPEISSKTENIDKMPMTSDKTSLRSHINLGLNMSILISMILVPAFLVLGKPLCEVLFGSAEAGKYVEAAAFLMVPMGINQISSSMLNSLGLEMKSLINYAIGAVLLILSIFFLPKYFGTYALIIGYGAMAITTSALNLQMLKKRGLLENKYLKYIALCLVFVLVSALASVLVYKLFILFAHKMIAVIISALISTLFMLLFYYIFNLAGIKGFVFRRKKAVARA